MNLFTLQEIQALRVMMKPPRVPMAYVVAAFWRHTRDELVEAIDALHRHPANESALGHVNQVLRHQAAGVKLVNGRPQRAASYNPTF